MRGRGEGNGNGSTSGKPSSAGSGSSAAGGAASLIGPSVSSTSIAEGAGAAAAEEVVSAGAANGAVAMEAVERSPGVELAVEPGPTDESDGATCAGAFAGVDAAIDPDNGGGGIAVPAGSLVPAGADATAEGAALEDVVGVIALASERGNGFHHAHASAPPRHAMLSPPTMP